MLLAVNALKTNRRLCKLFDLGSVQNGIGSPSYLLISWFVLLV